ncbi:MAG: hypothetical protein IJW57_11240 [Spirochaetaceae bacterium]|nr:hypothetical protein [Spirochaetaceae bacterium]
MCVVFSALFTIGCSDSLLHPAQDGARILVQLENSSLRSGDTPSPTEKWQGSAWIENQDGSKSHHQDISSAADEFSITFENVVIGSEIKIHLDVTSSGETAKRYRGSSSWKKIIDGVNVIVIVLKEVGVDAATPTITKQPEGKTENFAAGGTEKITKELMVEASVSDGGALTYQWHSNNTNSTEGGTAIEGATSASYEASVSAGETKYFYCIVTNTNSSVSGNKTASVTSNVAILASIEGSLESITARYNGTNHLWVGVSSTDFTVTENYSGAKSVEISPIDGLYTVEVPENSIGNVPVTIKSTKDDSIQTQVIVPIKYELDVNNLTITGGDTVTQNGNLVLTAQYKTVDGADVEYKLYDGSGSSNTYKVIKNVSISWTGVNQYDKWTANAETNNTGSKTATVKLSAGDQWCVTTDGIEKIHPYTVNAATTSNPDGYYVRADGDDSATGTFDAPFKTLAHAITQANINKKTIYVIGELTASSESSSDADTVFYVASAVGAMDNPIVIEGYGNGATLNATGSSKRVFETDYASYITMKNLTITGGNTSQSGGAIYYYQGELTLDNCTIKDNTSTYTGADYGVDGIYMYGSSNSLTMRHTKVENAVYLTSTSKADLGSGCVLGDITADTSSITLSDNVTINGTLNYKTSGGGITISTSLTTATAIELNVINPNSSSVILRTASGVDINDEYTKFNLQTEGYTWNISNGAAYLQSSSSN